MNSEWLPCLFTEYTIVVFFSTFASNDLGHGREFVNEILLLIVNHVFSVILKSI